MRIAVKASSQPDYKDILNGILDDIRDKHEGITASEYAELLEEEIKGHPDFHKLESAYQVFRGAEVDAAAKKDPFHTKGWHRAALKRWQKALKEVDSCLTWCKDNMKHMPAKKKAEVNRKHSMYHTFIAHAKEEIKFHEDMIKEFEKESNK